MRSRIAVGVLIGASMLALGVVQAAQRGTAGSSGTDKPAPTPRLADGTPNLGRVPGEKGVWDVRWVPDFGDRVVGHEVPEAQRKRGYDPKHPGAESQPWVPAMPWAAAVYNYNLRNEGKYDPEGYCVPPGGPRMMVTPYPMEIIQLPEQKRILMTFEGATHIWREIYMDGRQHPTGDALNPTYLGHSIGHWEGDTLVVDAVGFNENTWLDPIGHPHTDLLHLVEKFTRPNKNTLHYEVTIDDPGAYTKPWTVSWDIGWRANGELTEYICQENNKYLRRLTDDFGQPLFDVK
jgi:hypothetical protein